jgi:hypothetical protein
MDMGAATELGSFASFLGYWVPMMTAMMLPAAPPVLRRARVQSMPLALAYVMNVTRMYLIAALVLGRSFCLSIGLSTCRSHWPSWPLVSP